MKKLIFSLSLLMLCLCLIPTAAALADEKCGERGCERGCGQEICEQIKTMDNVADCRMALLHRHVFIAVKTKGITTSTSNKKLVENIKTKVMEICPDIAEIYVSTSVKAFTAIEDINNRKELKELLSLFGVKFEDFMPKREPRRDKEESSAPSAAVTFKPPIKLPYKDGDKRDFKDIIPKPLNIA